MLNFSSIFKSFSTTCIIKGYKDGGSEWITFKPIIEELKVEGYPINIIDIDENSRLATEYSIRSVPTTIILEDGKEIERFVGAKTKQLIQGRLIT